MRLRKLFYYLNVVFILSLCFSASSVFAEEKKDEKPSSIIAIPKEKKEENLSPQIKALQKQQEILRKDYEAKKSTLQEALQKILATQKEGTNNPTRQDLIKANQEEQDKVRKVFQEELRKLQAQERKLRLGRESLERPSLGGAQVKVYKEAVNEKQKRLDFQKRKEEQDKILRLDREQEKPRFQPKPVVTKPAAPTPSSTGSQSTGSQSQSVTPNFIPPKNLNY